LTRSLDTFFPEAAHQAERCRDESSQTEAPPVARYDEWNSPRIEKMLLDREESCQRRGIVEQAMTDAGALMHACYAIHEFCRGDLYASPVHRSPRRVMMNGNGLDPWPNRLRRAS